MTNVVFVVVASKLATIKKHHDNELHLSLLGFGGSYNELQLIILVLEARTLKRKIQDDNHPSFRGNNNETKMVGKKTLTFKALLLLMVFKLPLFELLPLRTTSSTSSSPQALEAQTLNPISQVFVVF
jgi:hypothetical protein